MLSKVKILTLIIIAWLITFAFLPQLFGNRTIRFINLPYLQLGAVSYSVVWYIWLRKMSKFWQTLDHELGHALFGVGSLRTIRELKVHHHGDGVVVHEGKGHSLLVSIAPYFFRLPVWISVLLVCLIQQRTLLHSAQFLLGASLVYASLAIWEEARPHQPDLRVYGLLCSYSWISAMNIFSLLLITTLTTGGSIIALFKRTLSLCMNYLSGI